MSRGLNWLPPIPPPWTVIPYHWFDLSVWGCGYILAVPTGDCSSLVPRLYFQFGTKFCNCVVVVMEMPNIPLGERSAVEVTMPQLASSTIVLFSWLSLANSDHFLKVKCRCEGKSGPCPIKLQFYPHVAWRCCTPGPSKVSTKGGPGDEALCNRLSFNYMEGDSCPLTTEFK
jgi:hypothetical protein